MNKDVVQANDKKVKDLDFKSRVDQLEDKESRKEIHEVIKSDKKHHKLKKKKEKQQDLDKIVATA